MEPYRPNEPFIKMKLNGSLLDRMVEAGIPLTRALQYFRDNPEGSALETLKLAAEDVVPFYGNYRNNGDLSDYAKEAVMLGMPVPGPRGKATIRHLPEETKVFNKKLVDKYPDIPTEYLEERPLTFDEYNDLAYNYDLRDLPNNEKVHIQDPEGMNLMDRRNKEEIVKELGDGILDEINEYNLSNEEASRLIDEAASEWGYDMIDQSNGGWPRPPYDLTVGELDNIRQGVIDYILEHGDPGKLSGFEIFPIETRLKLSDKHTDKLLNDMDNW